MVVRTISRNLFVFKKHDRIPEACSPSGKMFALRPASNATMAAALQKHVRAARSETMFAFLEACSHSGSMLTYM